MKQSLDEPAGSIFLIPFVQTFLVLGLFLSLLYNLPELTIFTLLILSLGLGAYLWSRASLNKVQLSSSFNNT